MRAVLALAVALATSTATPSREDVWREAAILHETEARALAIELAGERAKNAILERSLRTTEALVERVPTRVEREVPAWAWMTIGALAAGCIAATTVAIVEAHR